jgi:hypothetical protein
MKESLKMTDPIKAALLAAAGYDFDKLGGENMLIPSFIFPDGEVRPLEGTNQTPRPAP